MHLLAVQAVRRSNVAAGAEGKVELGGGRVTDQLPVLAIGGVVVARRGGDEGIVLVTGVLERNDQGVLPTVDDNWGGQRVQDIG